MKGMKSLKLAALVALPIFALPIFALSANAQTGRYDVKTINFDLWCQEQAKLPPERCDKREARDEQAFEAYRAKIEKYEIPFLERKDHEQQLDRTVLHSDPLADPVAKDNSQNAQSQAQSPPQ